MTNRKMDRLLKRLLTKADYSNIFDELATTYNFSSKQLIRSYYKLSYLTDGEATELTASYQVAKSKYNLLEALKNG